MKSSQVELVFIPTPGIGHLHSAVEAAKLIIQRNRCISILILILDHSADSSNKVNEFIDSKSQRNIYPNRLTFMTLPALPDPSSPSSFHSISFSLHKPLVRHAIQERIQVPGSSRLAGFILDMFCPAMMDVAAHFDVPSYIYFTSGACLLNVWLHLQSLVDDGVDITADDEFNYPNTEFHVPGFMNPVMKKVIPPEFFGGGVEAVSTLLFDHARRFRKCKGILVNTFNELETFGIQGFQDEVNKKNVPKIYPVGPILNLECISQGGSKADEQEETIIQWLNDQPLSSVVFLCFGSGGSFDANQVKELANGLEKSGHRFLWSLLNPLSRNDLPEGFIELTSFRGKIIGWAPQISVLAHPAIGGFVSHCGWNSTLESLWFGIPMATWPLYAEQKLNAFELVKELGLAVEVMLIDDDQRDYLKASKGKTDIVTAEEVENGVKKLMSLDENTKNKVREMRDKAREALEEGGSSHKSLGHFIQDIFSNIE